MSDTQKHTKPNVPNLRFPVFEGEWERMKATDLLDFFSTNSLSWEQLEYGGNGLLNLHYGLIHNGLPTQIDINESSLPAIKAGNEPRKFTLCKKGDIAFADASEDTNDVGKVVEFVDCAGKNVVCGLHTIHGRDKLDKTVPGFKGYAFSSKAFHDQIKRIAQGTKVFSISAGSFDEVCIGIPGKEEQKKIAALLSLIDQRIIIQNKVIEDLKCVKESITRRLINEIDESSRIVTLGEITEIVSRRNRNKVNYPMYSVTNDKGFVPQEEQFEDREMVGEDIGAYKIVLKDEIAYNPARINVGSIGQYTGDSPCMISSLYVCIKARKGIDSKWLIQVLRSEHLVYYYNLFAEGGVRLYLFYPNFSRIRITLPPLEQQSRIAATLGQIENKIELESSILSGYRQTKQALLCKLFV